MFCQTTSQNSGIAQLEVTNKLWYHFFGGPEELTKGRDFIEREVSQSNKVTKLKKFFLFNKGIKK